MVLSAICLGVIGKLGVSPEPIPPVTLTVTTTFSELTRRILSIAQTGGCILPAFVFYNHRYGFVNPCRRQALYLVPSSIRLCGREIFFFRFRAIKPLRHFW
jgi:hypothetical protein